MLKQTAFDKKRQVYTYDIYEDGHKVGYAQLRLKPSKSTDMPTSFESNVYYKVEEPYREKGYATAALKDLVNEASRLNLKPLIATVNTDNLASIKVIEKNKGKLVDQAPTIDGKLVLKYELEAFGEG